jgi:hypothetical protein
MPENGIQHQPVLLPADFYTGEVPTPSPLAPEIQYRKDIGEKGVKAADANLDKLVAAGMTDTPKARFNNSALVPELNITFDAAKADAKANAAIVADPNAGAPAAGAEVSPVKAKKALEALAKESPNPNAKP